MDWLWKWLLGRAKDYLIRNWQPTVVGILGAVLTQVPALAPHKDEIVAATLALLGVLSKQATATGTTAEPRLGPVTEAVLAKSAAAMVAAPAQLARPVGDPTDARIAAQSHAGP